MNSIGFEVWSRKAWQDENLGALAEDVRKLLQDLWEAVPVPDGRLAVHRRTHETPDVGSACLERLNLRQEVHEDGLHAKGHIGGAGAAGEEVGDAGEHADVRLSPDLFDGLRQDLKTTAVEDLSAGHQRTITTVHWGHVTLDVRVSDDREHGRHLGRF